MTPHVDDVLCHKHAYSSELLLLAAGCFTAHFVHEGFNRQDPAVRGNKEHIPHSPQKEKKTGGKVTQSHDPQGARSQST